LGKGICFEAPRLFLGWAILPNKTSNREVEEDATPPGTRVTVQLSAQQSTKAWRPPFSSAKAQS